MVQLAATHGQSLRLSQWLASRIETSPLGVIAMVSTLLDLRRPGLANNFVGETLRAYPDYFDLLTRFAEFLNSKENSLKAAQLFESLINHRKDHLDLYHRWRKAAYRAGDHRLHRYICQLASERFPDDPSFELEAIRSQIYSCEESMEAIHEASHAWSTRHFESKAKISMPFRGNTRPKVGLIGRFLHPMFLGPLLEHIDPTQIEIILITNDPRSSDIWSGDIIPMPEGESSQTLSTLKKLSLGGRPIWDVYIY